MSAKIVQLVVCAGLVGAAVLGAPTASADSRFNGTYTVQPANGESSTWTVSSDCETEGCLAHVTTSAGQVALFRQELGTWTGVAVSPLQCPAGTQNKPAFFSINAESFIGSMRRGDLTDPTTYDCKVVGIALIGPGSPATAPPSVPPPLPAYPPLPQAPTPGVQAPTPGVQVPQAPDVQVPQIPGVQPYDPNIFVPGFEPGKLFPSLPGTGGTPYTPNW